ncbi:MAG: hypothetical protein GXO89_14125 [Chlorobi bacterium]|nr:hypothetical protein [Chlorobiota bacterium]
MNNLATQYYVKARDNYPYNLEEVLESLNYALSYDDEYAAAHCLMGMFYVEQIRDYDKAFQYFEQALVYDLNYLETYYHYPKALINFGDLVKARKILTYAQSIKGICQSCILQLQALVFEKNADFKKAKKLIEKALLISIDNEEISFLNDELKRINKKIKKRKTSVRKKTA